MTSKLRSGRFWLVMAGLDPAGKDVVAMAGTPELTKLMMAIATLDRKAAADLLDSAPTLATAGLARRDEFFLAERLAQVYEGDTALHAAAFSYDSEMAQDLITRGADLRARSRRGAEPLHAAVMGNPSSAGWNPWWS